MDDAELAGHRVFVTGASGIVGSWLTRRLVEAGAYVVALVRDADPHSELFRSGIAGQVSIVNGSLEDYGTLERAINEHETDLVLHLGAQTIVGTALRSPLMTFESNIRGTYNLLEACRRLSSIVTAVVVASSDKAYGDSDVLPYTEDMPPLGRHPYDVSKSCTDLLSHTYAHTYELPVVIARCGNIYGGGDLNWSRIVPGTIHSAFRGERPVVRSDGTLIRDYIFVDDIVDAYLALAGAVWRGQGIGEAFNFSSESQVTVLEMVEAVLRAAGREDLSPEIRDTARAEIKKQYLDATKARTQLGWKTRFTLDAGLERTVDWYRTFFERSPGVVESMR
ncbi:MAG: GDP-mannose 4,6-dehydratase [Gemmatimonadota bacterium]|nr:GDP-mannose 4,6-dehydratase [Gemmatimonadota bacterium]